MRIAVLGGGVIGLSIGWRLLRSGHEVDLYDDQPGGGASFAAAGMLAPASEAWYGESELLNLGLVSRHRWPGFVADLLEDARTDPWLATTGTLLVAATAGDAADLDRLAELLAAYGEPASFLDRAQMRREEPGLSGHVRRVLSVPGDLSVHNRRLVSTLTEACTARGVTWHRERADVLDDTVDGPRVRGRDSAATVRADLVVIATGAAGPGTRPVKGQILRLHSPRPILGHTVRALVTGRPVYAVPRPDGEIVLGATAEEVGFDDRVTAEAVHDLLRLGLAVLPGLRDTELTETTVRHRPGTADNLPLIGRDGSAVLATGHFRGGVLLAPVTADAVCALVEGRSPPAGIEACDPGRLDARAMRQHTEHIEDLEEVSP